MNKKTQDLAWVSLPKEVREYFRERYKTALTAYNSGAEYGFILTMLEKAFGKANITSDTKPAELLFVERKKVQEYKAYIDSIINGDFSSEFKKGHCYGQQTALDRLFGDKCLPDKPSVQVEPKFKVGDKVRVLGGLANKDMEGKMAFVTRLPQGNCNQFVVTFENGLWTELSEKYLEPYTELEHRNLSQEIANCDKSETNNLKDNMEEKELNLAELLKGCVGEWFYVTPCGEMELKEINKLELKPLHFSKDAINCLTKTDGRAYENGSCIIYPSRALYEKYPLDAYSAWMEWKEARKPKRWRAEMGLHYWSIDSTGGLETRIEKNTRLNDEHYKSGNYFKDEHLADEASKGIRDYLKTFHDTHSEI